MDGMAGPPTSSLRTLLASLIPSRRHATVESGCSFSLLHLHYVPCLALPKRRKRRWASVTEPCGDPVRPEPRTSASAPRLGERYDWLAALADQPIDPTIFDKGSLTGLRPDASELGGIWGRLTTQPFSKSRVSVNSPYLASTRRSQSTAPGRRAARPRLHICLHLQSHQNRGQSPLI